VHITSRTVRMSQQFAFYFISLGTFCFLTKAAWHRFHFKINLNFPF